VKIVPTQQIPIGRGIHERASLSGACTSDQSSSMSISSMPLLVTVSDSASARSNLNGGRRFDLYLLLSLPPFLWHRSLRQTLKAGKVRNRG
jgi:hypothetical protein